jgi:uncharacterized protein
VNAVFLDTVGLIALWDRQDQWHAAARMALAHINLGQTRLVSTSWILLECANHAARKPYRTDVVRMREILGRGGDLYEPTPAEIDQA